MPFEPPTYFNRPAEICEVRFVRHDSKAAVAQLTDPGPAKNSAVTTKVVEVKTLPGTFKCLPFTAMKLPIGIWQYEQLEYASPNGYSYLLTAKDNPKIELRFSNSGVPFADESHFKSAMAKEPHELTKEELHSIDSSSSISTAKTENLNGKRVIAKSEHYADENKDVYEIEFNQNPDKSAVLRSATITFSAPAAEYKLYLRAVQKSLKTIKWQTKDTIGHDECQD
ncbi:hypothetical protein BH11CYA1_BH11CYA1_03550 [soil metagenome]